MRLVAGRGVLSEAASQLQVSFHKYRQRLVGFLTADSSDCVLQEPLIKLSIFIVRESRKSLLDLVELKWLS